MFGSFLITLREGLEAALIIGIMLAYLVRTGNRRAWRQVWLGVALAVAASLIAGGAIYLVSGEFSGTAEQVFEGSAMFLAVAVLTWMIFWMRKQATGIKAELHAQMRSAVASGSAAGLVLLAFVVVVREGIETVLFLFAATRVPESPVSFTLGGLLGLIGAVIIGYAIYKSATKLNLKTFFNVTSVILIVFAAGLLSHGIHEFHEAGLIPDVIAHVWDFNNVLSEKGTSGRFLTAVFGYDANPSLVQVIAYAAYLVLTLWAYFRSGRKSGARKPEPQVK